MVFKNVCMQVVLKTFSICDFNKVAQTIFSKSSCIVCCVHEDHMKNCYAFTTKVVINSKYDWIFLAA